MKNQLRAVDYLRVSTEEQVKGYGIQYSGKRTRRHIENKGWEHVGTFADEGVSGSVLAHERDDLVNLMALARQTPRPFDVVTVLEERAIGRAGRAFWPWVWELEDLGVFVAVVKGDYDNTTPDGRSRMRKAADKAEDERETIRERTQGGIQEKAEEGLHPGGKARYGYRIEEQGKVGLSHLKPDECDGRQWCSRAEPCETLHETAVLRRGRQLVVQYHGSWKQAVLMLNAEGMVNRAGKPWSVQNFRGRLLGALDPTYVFRSAANAALDQDGKPLWGESVTIALDPVFTPAEVAELKAACDPKVQVRSGRSRVYPLSGRIASLCGSYYYGGSPADRAVASHYICKGKEPLLPGGDKCSCAQLDADGVEGWAWEQVVAQLSPARLEELAQRELARTSEQRIDHSSRLAALDQFIAEQQDAIDAAMPVAAKTAARRGLRGKAAQESISRAIAPLEDELEALEEQRREVTAWQADASEAARRADDFRALAQRAAEGLADLDPAAKLRLYALLEISVKLTSPPPGMRKGIACSVAAWFEEQGRLVPVVTDRTWSLVAPLLPGKNDRLFLEAITEKAATGARWTQIHEKYGTTGVRNHWRRWSAAGLWEKVMAALPTEGRPVPRRHPLPSMELHGVLQPSLILADPEDHAVKAGPWGSFTRVTYRFTAALAA